MRVTWCGLELPTSVERDTAVVNNKYGKFLVEPFERGFGTTIGNSLRRILLSSLEGSAVTSVTIKGVDHEFTSIKGVMEDVTEIVLNVKKIVIRMQGDEPKTIRVCAEKQGEVTAAMIETDLSLYKNGRYRNHFDFKRFPNTVFINLCNNGFVIDPYIFTIQIK